MSDNVYVGLQFKLLEAQKAVREQMRVDIGAMKKAGISVSEILAALKPDESNIQEYAQNEGMSVGKSSAKEPKSSAKITASVKDFLLYKDAKGILRFVHREMKNSDKMVEFSSDPKKLADAEKFTADHMGELHAKLKASTKYDVTDLPGATG